MQKLKKYMKLLFITIFTIINLTPNLYAMEDDFKCYIADYGDKFLIADYKDKFLLRSYEVSEKSLESWPSYFKDLWCPDMEQPIDKKELLDHPDNAFWKDISNINDQEQKNEYLRQALKLPGGDPAYKQRRKAIACALATGADPNVLAYGTYGKALLPEASLQNDYYLAKLALKYGADPNLGYIGKPLENTRTLKMVQLLIEHKADINTTNEADDNLIHLCIIHKRPDELLLYYIQQGLNVNAQDDRGMTPLTKLARSDFFDAKKMQILFDARADITIRVHEINGSFFSKNTGENFWEKAKRNLNPEQLRQAQEIAQKHHKVS